MNTVKIKGQILSNSNYKTITAESIGIETVAFEFDDSWNGLSIFACFKNSNIDQEYHIKMSEPYEVKIPWEVMSVCGVIYIGVLGFKGTEIVKPTIWRAAADVVKGVSPNGANPEDATPNVVAQITEIADNAVNIAQSVRDDADAGKFKGEKGEKGDSGVYIGSGDVPDGYNIQIDPNGEPDNEIGHIVFENFELTFQDIQKIRTECIEKGKPLVFRYVDNSDIVNLVVCSQVYYNDVLATPTLVFMFVNFHNASKSLRVNRHGYEILSHNNINHIAKVYSIKAEV